MPPAQTHDILPLWELFRNRMLTPYLVTSTEGGVGGKGEIEDMGIKSFLVPGSTIRPGKWPKKSYLFVFAQSYAKNASLLPAEALPALLKVSACCKTSGSRAQLSLL